MKKIYFLFAMLMLATASFAQVTTSGLSGKIVDGNGEPMIGATVIATHTPSGTEYGAATNADGRYTIQGMRPGSPYTVNISFIGFQTLEYTDVVLRLGETTSVNGALQEGQQLDQVVVTATSKDRFDANKTGAAVNFNSEQIATAPTVTRSIYDIVKFTPQASSKNSGMSFAGSNNRYNSFQIDGAVSNDVFGLAGTGTNGGQTGTNPVSLDAIEEIQVVVAPFDVRQSGFTGGGINAVTKSGTNEIKGTAYTYYNNQNFYGTTAGDDVENREKLTEQMTQTYGATIGAPIIKDKLFIFASGEFYKEQYPSSWFPGVDAGYVTASEIQQIVDRYAALTGITEEYANRDIITQSVDVMARVDWNINQNNKLMVRYQLKDSYKDVYGSSYSTYYLNNSTYKFTDKTHSFVVELNSRLSNTISNEFRAGYTRVRDFRDAPYQAPTVQIENVGPNGNKTVQIGTEYSSGVNSLDQDVFTLTDNLSIYKGSHTLTFGTHNEFYSMANGFIQAANGAYYYKSVGDFLADNAYQYRYNQSDVALTGTDKWRANFRAAQLGFYAQDEWKPTDLFTLTAGVRIDIPYLLDKPTYNAAYNGSEFAASGEHVVGQVPTAKVLWSPRVGFRYYFNESKNTLLRGGAGIFTGRVPFVWLSNVYGNTGMEMKSTTLSGADIPAFSMTQAPITGSVAASGQTINTVSDDFKYPQVFRVNLGLEHNFANSWKVTLEGIYSKTMNNVFFNNIALTDSGKAVNMVSTGAANSANTTTYYDRSRDYYAIVNLENTNKGYTYNLSAMVQKSFDFGLDLMASYAFTRAMAVNDGTSSVAYSNWKYNYSVRSNDANELHFSTFDSPHNINVTANYATPVYSRGRMQTVFGLTYQGYHGGRTSLTYNESKDLNNDGQWGNNLMYIPTLAEVEQMNWIDVTNSAGDVTMSAADSKANFINWLSTNEYASENQGSFAGRNGILTPFEHHFNLHVSQHFFYDKKNGRKLSISLDMLNVGNLFNRGWGTSYNTPYTLSPLKIAGLTADASGENYTPSYTWNSETEFVQNDIYSRWRMQLGVRLTF